MRADYAKAKKMDQLSCVFKKPWDFKEVEWNSLSPRLSDRKDRIDYLFRCSLDLSLGIMKDNCWASTNEARGE